MSQKRLTDIERAKQLGMTLDEFQSLVVYDPAERYSNFNHAGYIGPSDKKKKDKKKEKEQAAGKDKDAMPEIPSEYVPFETDDDVNNKRPHEIENYWDRPVVTDEDEALYYGFHIHSKDNVYGLHAHYPGGPLGGGHTHGPQNQLGYHTHRYSAEELMQFKFANPGVMIELDGPHTHECNAPDGKHIHSEENFGPANSRRSEFVAERNARVDKNKVNMLSKPDTNDLYDQV